jgi:NAD(P)-dependent dehydrogenase (short-subunit alcohol dehydrogenase family)
MTARTAKGPDALRGKAALVTGGANPIGRAIVQRLHAAGACVALTDHAAADPAGAARALAPDGALFAAEADVRDPDAVARMIDAVEARLEGLDILVHAAGVARLPPGQAGPLHHLSPVAFAEAVDVNLKGAFLCSRAALGPMMRRKHGQIVHVSSAFRESGASSGPADSAARFGVVGFSEALAQEVRAAGIRVFAFRPDAVRLPPWDQDGSGNAPPPPLHPERIAELVAFMLSLPMDTTLSTVSLSAFRPGRRRGQAKRAP